MNYQSQIDRIRQKLPLAKATDKKCKIFAASSHRYELGKPIDESSLQAFEQKYQITLPDDYRAFLLQITNGGKSSYAHTGIESIYSTTQMGTEVLV